MLLSGQIYIIIRHNIYHSRNAVNRQVWPENLAPFIQVGTFYLNRNPSNYFDNVEQVAFSPGNLPPGIEPSIDKVLHVRNELVVFAAGRNKYSITNVSFQGRIFSYPDTHRHRLGPNHLQLPINCPYNVRTGVHNQERDGFASFSNQNGAPNYYLISFYEPQISVRAKMSTYKVQDSLVAR